MSGNVELNPELFKNCPKCESSVGVRTQKCTCGHVYVKSKRNANDLNVIEKRMAMRNIRANESEVENKEQKVLNSLSMSKKNLTGKHCVDKNLIDWQKNENVCLKLKMKHCVEKVKYFCDGIRNVSLNLTVK